MDTRPTAFDRSHQVRHITQRAYHEREGRKEGQEEGIGVNVLIGKRKEDVEVEEVKEGRGCRGGLRSSAAPRRTRSLRTPRCAHD